MLTEEQLQDAVKCDGSRDRCKKCSLLNYMGQDDCVRRLAETALEMMNTHSEGCEYCCIGNEKVMHTEDCGTCKVEVFLANDVLEVNAYNHVSEFTEAIAFNFPAKHCPMCGRRQRGCSHE